MYRASFLFLTTALSLHAQSPAPAVGRENTALPAGRVTGHIFCADTHAPARQAKISLVPLPEENGKSADLLRRGRGRGEGFSDLNGAFVIDHASPGTYAVQVELTGYLDPMSGIDLSDWESLEPEVQRHLRATGVTIRGGEVVALDVELMRGAAISGQILYDDGAPAADVSVQAVSSPTSANRTRTGERSLPAVSTDDQGKFRIAGVPPGEYRVIAGMVQANVFARDTAQAVSLYLNTQQLYAPGTFHKKEASTFKIVGSEEMGGVAITIPTRGLHLVRGSVVRQTDGIPVVHGAVQLTDASDRSFSRNADITPDGSFVIAFVPSGTYRLRVDGAFDATDASGSQPPKVSREYGPVEEEVTVSTNDVSGITLQVPEKQTTLSFQH
ncbi:carboxypeptidase regulatory-like domain-containing protein [Terriglobus albidus]|uniref:Carboxypeptidase regulatory-like domain-containing protein n=1 Tax=Terriglobus albidus TaxID=1592106 RepID=A0A5B9EG66_9BACT|nr:carboxypeptidase regulatory-like domain-containing protein [Terriglobus albidus]QEE30135.1 carboxypeptidase regulatory-like domain-containing protein [Terriglobus albidus]